MCTQCLHYAMQSVKYKMYSIQCILYNLQCTMYSVHCTLYIALRLLLLVDYANYFAYKQLEIS